ncbi:MAG: hypothetical protein PHE15_07355 [Dehalococcoidales bacterium]|nr:hypothetical protein [Dehalococcoidales bacterium]
MEDAKLHAPDHKAVVFFSDSLNTQSTDFDKKAVLLFSGGRDSTAVAAAFCSLFPKGELHFLFFDNGLLADTNSTRNQFEMLSELYPNVNVSFKQINIRSQLCAAGMKFVENDLVSRRYTTLLICVACKTIMNYECAKYAVLTGVKVVLDGSAVRQNMFPEQTRGYLDFLKSVYNKFGLLHISPLYDYLTSKEVVTETLNELGIRVHKQEPSCMWADAFSTANEAEIFRYASRTLEIIQSLDNK